MMRSDYITINNIEQITLIKEKAIITFFVADLVLNFQSQNGQPVYFYKGRGNEKWWLIFIFSPEPTDRGINLVQDVNSISSRGAGLKLWK